MKCQKCAKSAVVHLTEVISELEGGTAGSGIGGGKRAVEIHLCLNHAVEAGLLTPAPESPQEKAPGGVGKAGESEQGISITPAGKAKNLEAEGPGAIVPAHNEPSSLVVSRDRSGQASDPATCPVCGMNWSQFKQAGLMGCPHDYEQFNGKLLPLLKRAQEGATEHMGKVPKRSAAAKSPEADRQVKTLRLRRQMQKAIEAEHYEQAAALRDKLRQLEQN